MTCSMMRTILLIAMISYLTVFANKVSTAIARIALYSSYTVSMVVTMLTKTIINDFAILTYITAITDTFITINFVMAPTMI